ncbi:MAG: AAHS family 4-hydroxybenzoate transporter-like MFS transporter [Halieaceae bacterium]|jgi:AAHS family 4-hydroxybenzoate transporter-like MFS transporter
MSSAIAGPNTEMDSIVDNGKISGLQWTVVLVAFILNMLDGFDVTAMAFTAHRIGEQLAISPEHLGLVFSVALGGMMVGAMFVAPFSDVIGRRKMILMCIVVVGISMIATGFSTTLWQLIITRLVTGLGVGGLLASLATITAEYTPAKYRSLTVVAITAGYPLGATLGSFIAVPLLEHYGWQSVFLAGGCATMAMVVVAWLCLPESIQFLVHRRPAGALETLNKILVRLKATPLEQMPQEEQSGPHAKANVLSLLTPDRRARTIQLWLTFFFCFITLYFLMSWLPKLVVLAGMSEAEGVYGAAAFNGGAVLGILTLGWLASHIKLSLLISLFLTTTAACMLLFALAAEHLPMLASLSVIGFFLQGGFTGLYAVAAKVYPVEVRTTGVGWAIGIGRFGAVVGPFAGGIMIAQGISMADNFLVFAIPAFVAGILAWYLKVD